MTVVLRSSDNSHLISRFSNRDEHAISKFYGDPLVSSFSNIMIESIAGNSSLKNAQVICLSDYHYDGMQKYIRAQIINEVVHSRNMTDKDAIFLVEGTQSGYEPNAWVYDKLIGENLLNFDHLVFGWDNMKLNRLGINLIKSIQYLYSLEKKVERKYIKLNILKSESLNNKKISVENMLNLIEGLENEMESLMPVINKYSASIKLMLKELRFLSDIRNECLYHSIYKILEEYSNSIIFVIGGGYHLKCISDFFHDVHHCVVNLKETRKMIDYDEALKEVYGDFSVQCQNMQIKSQRLLSRL